VLKPVASLIGGTPATTPHAPLTNRDGAALGVEPLQRGEAEEATDGSLARRAAALERNRWRSTPPPGG